MSSAATSDPGTDPQETGPAPRTEPGETTTPAPQAAPAPFDLEQHRVPCGLDEVFYIPEFVTADEEAYLVRKVRLSLSRHATLS